MKIRSKWDVMIRRKMGVIFVASLSAYLCNAADGGKDLLVAYEWKVSSNAITCKAGFIDAEGNWIIRPHYNTARSFQEGLASVTLGRLGGYVDRSGNTVIPLKFSCVPSDFSESLAVVDRDGRQEYISKSGDPQWGRSFASAGPFSQGRAFVKTNANGKWSLLSKDGRFVVKEAFDDCGYLFSDEGLAPVKVGKKWGYVDTDGKVAIASQFDTAGRFSEGLACVRMGNELTDCGYIDRNGKFIIKRQFSVGNEFSEGLASICIGGKWGYVNNDGSIQISCQFENARAFHEGLAAVLTMD